ncbi:hypothetical protein SFRURICE_020254, partial [Spodoptera frugiperda]
VATDTLGDGDRATISGHRPPARTEPDPCVRRVAFRARLKEPSDHHRGAQ